MFFVYLGQVSPQQRFHSLVATPVARFQTIGPGWARIQLAAIPLYSENDPNYTINAGSPAGRS